MKNNSFYKAVSDKMESVLKEYGKPIPSDTFSSAMKEVRVENDRNEYEFDFFTVYSSDIIETVKIYHNTFKFYNDNIGLKMFEKDFWLNEILNILENESEAMSINDIISKVKSKYQDKFGLDLNENEAKSDVIQIIESLAVTHSRVFKREYEEKGLIDLLQERVLSKIGLTKWQFSVPLIDEIIEILKESDNHLATSRLCYNINDRKKYFEDEYNDITEKDLIEKIKEYPKRFKLDDNETTIELVLD